MIFTELALAGAYAIDVEAAADARGLFARTFCVRELAAAGLYDRFVQCNTSFNAKAGTLRGLHWQADPHPEIKIVRCTRGRILDVLVDLRPGSPTRHRTVALELSAESRRALYVPAGLAHGFQTLEDGSEVFYHMSDFYVPELARGARWDDPRLGLAWPILPPILSPRDAGFADLEA